MKLQHRPKEIIINVIDNEEGVEYRLHKKWSNKKVSEAYLITNDLSEMVEEYGNSCKTYGIQPNMKRVYEVIKKYNKQNKLQSYESSIFTSH